MSLFLCSLNKICKTYIYIFSKLQREVLVIYTQHNQSSSKHRQKITYTNNFILLILHQYFLTYIYLSFFKSWISALVTILVNYNYTISNQIIIVYCVLITIITFFLVWINKRKRENNEMCQVDGSICNEILRDMYCITAW